MPELIRISMDLEGHPQALLEETEQLELRKEHKLPERSSSASASDIIVWWDSPAFPVSGSPSAYYTLGRPSSVLVPAGPAEPDVLARFAGVIAEVFPGPPLRVEDINKALRRIRGRE
jgi:hypothetical protein